VQKGTVVPNTGDKKLTRVNIYERKFVSFLLYYTMVPFSWLKLDNPAESVIIFKWQMK